MKKRSAVLSRLLESIDKRGRLVEFWTATVKNSTATVTLYSCRGRTFLVYEYGGGDGWDIYIAASASNMVKPTFEALLAYLQLPAEENAT